MHSGQNGPTATSTKKYKALLFTLSVLACVMVAPGYVPALAGQDPVHERGSQKPHSHATTASPLLDESVVRKMLDSGKASEANHVNVLGQLAGDWYYTAAIWAVPGAEPRRTTGTVTNQMVMENRFLSSKVGGFLDLGGQKVLLTGQGYLGYDNSKKSFTSVWFDTMTTGMMIGGGQYDKKDNAIKETGQFTNPLTGREERFRSELQFTDAENYKRTIFVIGKSGKESKLMEFDYSKRKK
jgi:uncharacterized protein DUF1579